jgi:hypothetical protein
VVILPARSEGSRHEGARAAFVDALVKPMRRAMVGGVKRSREAVLVLATIFDSTAHALVTIFERCEEEALCALELVDAALARTKTRVCSRWPTSSMPQGRGRRGGRRCTPECGRSAAEAEPLRGGDQLEQLLAVAVGVLGGADLR